MRYKRCQGDVRGCSSGRVWGWGGSGAFAALVSDKLIKDATAVCDAL
jgi:hypothetical protein